MLVEKLALREWISLAGRYQMRAVRTIEEIRHARLLQLLEMPEYSSVQALADKLERSNAQISQWKNRSKRKGGGLSNITSESARYIEHKVGKPTGWMDNDPVYDTPAGNGGAPKLDFTARVPSDSDWATLQDIAVLPHEEREALLRDIRAKAEKWRVITRGDHHSVNSSHCASSLRPVSDSDPGSGTAKSSCSGSRRSRNSTRTSSIRSLLSPHHAGFFASGRIVAKLFAWRY